MIRGEFRCFSPTMKRPLRRSILAFALATTAGASTGWAQSIHSGPSGSASVHAGPSGSTSSSTEISAAPSVAPSATVPPGHPPVGTTSQPLPPGHPSTGPDDDEPRVGQDVVVNDGSIPAGSIRVLVVDETERPLAGVTTKLIVKSMSVSDGDKQTTLSANSNALGISSFDGLKTGTKFVYHVELLHNDVRNQQVSARYVSQQFTLTENRGVRVLQHRFPVEHKIDSLLVAFQGVDTIVEVRDDLIEVQQTFDVINAGKITWALGPDGMLLRLPSGFKGLRAAESHEDHTVTTAEGVGAKWLGSFPPGLTRVSYNFKVPHENTSTLKLALEMPDRVLAARVQVPARRGMGLTVTGFPAAERVPSTLGFAVLTTVRQGSPQDRIRSLDLEISGLPTISNTRWIAAWFGLGLMSLTLLWTLFADQSSAKREKARAIAQARKLKKARILDDLVVLERAHKTQQVGPKAYAKEREKLVSELAVLID